MSDQYKRFRDLNKGDTLYLLYPNCGHCTAKVTSNAKDVYWMYYSVDGKEKESFQYEHFHSSYHEQISASEVRCFKTDIRIFSDYIEFEKAKSLKAKHMVQKVTEKLKADTETANEEIKRLLKEISV